MYRWQSSFDSEQLLKKASIETIFTPEKRNYGSGWSVGNWKGHKLAAHSGSIDGFSSHIFRFPEDPAAVIVLLNNSLPLAQPTALDLTAILFGEQYELPKERKEIAVGMKILDFYVGQYEVAPGFVFNITKEGEKLTFLPPGQPKAVEMFAESESEFFLKVVDAQITFVKDENGKVTGLKFQQMGRTTNAKKVK